ncbi:glutathione peroxidase [Cohnella suwonensis]|uniref:Glutathione peroxidase n=1 Tax=Cohnella suwonensis TaxID=696072 RepID=A0ABW0LTC6_9BACL
MSIYSFSPRKANGEAVNLGAYEGKALLIVNTASECGLTPQFKELQELHETYKDRGLAVLGFPCNQFGGQEPGTAAEAEAFCSLNYGVTFPMFEKLDVKGPDADPLFAYLTESTGAEITWNFAKFLVDGRGKVVKHFEPTAKPLELKPEIEKLLG